ncbi:MAG: hypothetical protein GEV08_05245 [Acidimicrobiia bacterium]|nr:hypothetical protein [Acidimicrobiia bacterium]
MTVVHRVLPASPYNDLDSYVRAGGGRALDAAGKLGVDGVMDEVEASGLRGRGGAGFPTARKWRTVRDNLATALRAAVVVNAAEGEPGTFKDRAILEADPYQVLEGALVAARVVGANEVIIGLKASFAPVVARVRAAVEEVVGAGWADGVRISIVEGPDEYLYGEETALLEVVNGRPPFPRIAPPYRRGATDVVESDADTEASSGLSARVDMAGPGGEELAPPALVNNVETLANVAHIVAEGAERFRSYGTAGSPGTVVCTVTGSVAHAGVGEVRLGTPLRAVIDAIGGGARKGRTIRAVLNGVSGAVLSGKALDTPLSHEAFAAAGSGLGSAGFIVLDDADDPVSVAAGASRFLAVESCGQCSPCKADGLEIAASLGRMSTGRADEDDLDVVRERIDTIADGARCALASQHEVVVRSMLKAFPAEFEARLRGGRSVEPAIVAEVLAIEEGAARWDVAHRDKQPDWTTDVVDSGQWPAERLDEHRFHRSGR